MEPEPSTPETKHFLVKYFLDNLRLTDAEWSEFWEELKTPNFAAAYPVIKAYYDESYEKGVAIGRRRGIEIVLRRRIGPLSETVRQRIATHPAEKLDELFDAALDGKSLKEVGLED